MAVTKPPYPLVVSDYVAELMEFAVEQRPIDTLKIANWSELTIALLSTGTIEWGNGIVFNGMLELGTGYDLSTTSTAFVADEPKAFTEILPLTERKRARTSLRNMIARRSFINDTLLNDVNALFNARNAKTLHQLLLSYALDIITTYVPTNAAAIIPIDYTNTGTTALEKLSERELFGMDFANAVSDARDDMSVYTSDYTDFTGASTMVDPTDCILIVNGGYYNKFITQSLAQIWNKDIVDQAVGIPVLKIPKRCWTGTAANCVGMLVHRDKFKIAFGYRWGGAMLDTSTGYTHKDDHIEYGGGVLQSVPACVFYTGTLPTPTPKSKRVEQFVKEQERVALQEAKVTKAKPA